MKKEELLKIIDSIETPEHDESDDGITCRCWCFPKVIMEGDSFIFVHNDLIDREVLKEKLGLF